MSHNPLIRKLQRVMQPSAEEQANLEAACGKLHGFDAKQDIISEGDRPNHIHLIVEGWAARYKLLPDGSRQITALLIPGDFCNIHTTILGQMDHGIVALTACQVAYVSAQSIDELTANSAKLTRAFWWATLVDEAVMRQWIVNNGRRDAFEAIAHLLCEMHLRMRIVELGDDDRFSMPLTQEEIADATGLTPIHTNRILQRLRADGLIELKKRVLTILNVEALLPTRASDPAGLR